VGSNYLPSSNVCAGMSSEAVQRRYMVIPMDVDALTLPPFEFTIDHADHVSWLFDIVVKLAIDQLYRHFSFDVQVTGQITLQMFKPIAKAVMSGADGMSPVVLPSPSQPQCTMLGSMIQPYCNSYTPNVATLEIWQNDSHRSIIAMFAGIWARMKPLAGLFDEPWRTVLLVLKSPFVDDSELNIINPSGVAKARLRIPHFADDIQQVKQDICEAVLRGEDSGSAVLRIRRARKEALKEKGKTPNAASRASGSSTADVGKTGRVARITMVPCSKQ
jgi:hypothetical protein